MNVLYPGIERMKELRDKAINYLASYLPEGEAPAPPGLQNYLSEPATWQGMGRGAMNFLMPQPEDTMFGLMKPLFPRILNPLISEAKKYKSFDDFQNAFIKDIKHGRYYHITDDPNFIIDPNKGPMDLSSLAGSPQSDVGKLMVTSHLENWLPQFPQRNHVAIIDMSKVPNNVFRNTTRGFGNEFFVDDPSSASVLKILNRKAALSDSRRYQDALESYIRGPEDLKKLYEYANEMP